MHYVFVEGAHPTKLTDLVLFKHRLFAYAYKRNIRVLFASLFVYIPSRLMHCKSVCNEIGFYILSREMNVGT